MLSNLARARLFAPPAEAQEIDQALAAMRSFSLDLLMARRLLQSWDHGGAAVTRLVHYGGGARRAGGHASAFSSFARGQLQLQAFDAPPSWAAGGDGDGDAEPPCAVCLEPVLTGRVVAGPACLHRLHEACALQLAASATSVVCPTCRAPLLAVHCRAPGEARDCAGDEEETEDEDDGEEVVAARGITAQDLQLLQLLLQQAARSAGRQRAWFSGPPLPLEASSGEDGEDDGSSDEEDEQRRRRAGRRSSLMRRIFCRRRDEESDAAELPASSENADAPPPGTEAGAAADAAASAEAGAAAREPQPQCGCVLM